MVVIFVIFAICCINFDSVSGSDDRISRLEKLVEAQNVMIRGFKKEFDLGRDSRLLLSGSNGDSSPIIAFHAYLSKTETDPGHHHTIIFDSVLSNSGNGYNNHTGAFTAPLGGMYVFAFSVVGYPGTRMPVQLVINSNVVGATAGDSISSTLYPSASTVVVIHLNQNDACFLRTTTNTGWNVGSLYSSDWSRSSFSAWKL
ncbi:C1QL [Mytilus coruscus]|uniref:C1QL n=1 Tax=Mytilus coruscus TaxID=42192 RepID=A0A6J8BPY5_MYTCO|nr:C1QL [Mytilus coruscus]